LSDPDGCPRAKRQDNPAIFHGLITATGAGRDIAVHR
jgi:hypothetical protein